MPENKNEVLPTAAELTRDDMSRDILAAWLHTDQALRTYRRLIDPEDPAYDAGFAESWSGQYLDTLLWNLGASGHAAVLTGQDAVKHFGRPGMHPGSGAEAVLDGGPVADTQPPDEGSTTMSEFDTAFQAEDTEGAQAEPETEQAAVPEADGPAEGAEETSAPEADGDAAEDAPAE